MRKLTLSALLGLGIFGIGAAFPGEASASWLSEALNNTQIQLNIGSQYPQYPAYAAPVAAPAYFPAVAPMPTYAPPAYGYRPVAPAPIYPAYRVPTYPVQTFAPAPVCNPVPTVPVATYRPVPVYPPQHSHYGPNPWERDWRR